MIRDATPLTFTIAPVGNKFYYTIDPNEEESNVIIEAIPKWHTTPFELYAKVITIDANEKTENHEHATSLPVWMEAEDSVVSGASQKIIYNPKHSQYKDLSLTLKNTKTTLDVLLIVIKSTSIGEAMELVVTSSNVQPLKIDHTYVGTVVNKDGKFKLYEANVMKSKEDESFVVELENCVGSSEIFVSRSFADLVENKFESRSSKLELGKVFAPLPTNSLSEEKYVIAVASNNEREGFSALEYSEF